MTAIPSLNCATNDPAMDPRPSTRRLARGLFVASVILAAIQAWATRYSGPADPISYMDMAIAISQGRFGEAINGYWSPLYPCLVAMFLALINPSPVHEYAVAHLVNIVVFIFTALSFHYFWSWAWLQRPQGNCDRQAGSGANPASTAKELMPDWAWWALGYGLFTWTSLDMIRMSRCAPDLFLAGFTYLAIGLTARIRAGRTDWRIFAWLGLVVGIGYLSKTIMFMFGFMFIAVAGLVAGRPRQTWLRVLLSLAIFLGVSSPYIAALSIKQGRLTYSDVGRIGYALYVSGYHPDYVAHDEAGDNPLFGWQGGIPGLGEPVHPKRLLHVNPTIEEFATPIGGSYPYWYDPTWWHEGMKASFNARGQLKAFADSAKTFKDIFWPQQCVLIVGFGLLMLRGPSIRQVGHSLARHWWLLVPATCGSLLFSSLLVLPRYVAVFIVMLWASVFLSVRADRTAKSQRFMRIICILSLISLIFLLGKCLTPAFAQTAIDLRYRADMAPNPGKRMIEGLATMGIGPGDSVGHIGKALKSWSYWASAARVRIVAELRPGDQFWKLSEAEQTKLIDVFRKQTSVKALIARERPGQPIQAKGWKSVKHTPFYVYHLNR